MINLNSVGEAESHSASPTLSF
jgi:hypothetical protein